MPLSTIEDSKIGGSENSGTSETISGIVISGLNRYLLVGAGMLNTGDGTKTFTSVVLDPGGGDETTLAAIVDTDAIVGPDDGRVGFYGLANPPTGTFDILITFSGSKASGEWGGGIAWALSEVNQSTPVSDGNAFTGTTATPNADLTTDVNDYCFGVCFEETGGTTVAGPTAGTEDFDNDATSSGDGFAGGHQAGSATTTNIAFAAINDKVVMSCIAINYEASAVAALDQDHFRWYDDGSESGSVAAAAEDATLTDAKEVTKQLRVTVEETDDAAGVAATYQLEVKDARDGDATYRKVT